MHCKKNSNLHTLNSVRLFFCFLYIYYIFIPIFHLFREIKWYCALDKPYFIKFICNKIKISILKIKLLQATLREKILSHN